MSELTIDKFDNFMKAFTELFNDKIMEQFDENTDYPMGIDVNNPRAAFTYGRLRGIHDCRALFRKALGHDIQNTHDRRRDGSPEIKTG